MVKLQKKTSSSSIEFGPQRRRNLWPLAASSRHCTFVKTLVVVKVDRENVTDLEKGAIFMTWYSLLELVLQEQWS